MAETKSGIETPAEYNGKKPSSIDAPVKEYPASSKLGKGSSGPSISSPCEDYGRGSKKK